MASSASKPPQLILNKATGESKTLKQWKTERETLSNLIQSFERQVQELITSKSSSTKHLVDDVLRDFYALGSKTFKEKPKKEELKALGSSVDKLLVHIQPVNSDPGHWSMPIDILIQIVFKLYPPTGERKYLQHNFGPVADQTPPTNLVHVEEGRIPDVLNGMMLRNGPNPQYNPEGNYMWMDGDSMIHGIRFKKGLATYVARYTQTARFIQEQHFKKSLLLKYGDQVGAYGLFAALMDELRKRLDILDSRYGETTANTGLVCHGGRIMALEDFGRPHIVYVTEEGDLETVGINDYDGKLDHWLSPHPRKDPITGEMFNLGSLRTSPYCIYRVISKEGVMGDPVPIRVTGPTYMHELCITENYVIFQDLPLVCDSKKMETSEKEWIFYYDDTKRPRYGILPRHAKTDDAIKWFQFEGSFFVFHNVNAWEEDNGTIVLYCCNMEAEIDPRTNRSYIAPASFQRFNHNENDFTPTMPELYKMTFNIKKPHEKPRRESISNPDPKKQKEKIYGDWPKINLKYFGRKTQFVYIGEVSAENKIISVVKYDLKEKYGKPIRYRFESHTFGSEVVFVPKSDSSTIREDDGYLITFVHHEDADDSKNISYVYVIDALTMKRVAKIRLPSRVPYGFHAIYVTEEELQNQIRPSKI